MPRTARKLSATETYHIIMRGVNKQQIFYDDDDRNSFLQILRKYNDEYDLYAYCLMGNHIHLLMRIGKDALANSFRRIGASFVYHYNLKYDRTGHLFQDRFLSEPVESKRYFFTVLRYILQNPVKAGLCNAPEEYAYSSMREYLGSQKGITNTEFALKMISREHLLEFLRSPNEDSCLEPEESKKSRVTNAVALNMIQKEFGGKTFGKTDTVSDEKLRDSIHRLRSSGVSVRQICRMTGLPKKIVEK